MAQLDWKQTEHENPKPDTTESVDVVRELRLEAAFSTKLNLADFQNSVPLLRELQVVSTLTEESKGLELVLESIPAFVRAKRWRLDSVGAGQSYRVQELDVQLDGVLLSKLTEAEQATVTLTLKRADAGPQDDPVVISRKVELLPRNQWGGIAHMPDMIAAFVQPNEPAIDRLLKKAADVLRDNGKDASLDGYKGGPKRAWEIASAIWGAVVGMKLDYALPPASFEHSGQKIRSSGQIADSGLATCLDLALLFCSALEQAGLNPLLIFTKGHAFAGVWLKHEEFSSSVVDDITALRKRVKLKELVLFETTLVAQRPGVPFRFAADNGTSQVSEEQAERFELAVDVRRARLQRIKPLASNETPLHQAKPEDDGPTVVPFDEAPDLPDDIIVEGKPSTLDPKDRLARWQRKLLDLSMRNNLLNFKAGKKSLKLEAPDPGALEDLMSDGKEVRLLQRPDLMDGSDPRNQAIHEARERENLRRTHAVDALKRREVFVSLPQEELETRLVDLYRSARTTLQEGGANTLFLALGFLTWTRDEKDEKTFKAPLVLLPVTLNRKSVRSGFSLTIHEDEPRFNPTLIEMLRQDFKLELGIQGGELAQDDAGVDIAKIWRTVSAAVKDIKGWEVSEDVYLSMFSFAKYLMWVDLVQRTDQLRQNNVVKHLLDTPRDPFPSTSSFPNPKVLDRDFGPEQTFCPLPADSSQLAAVMAAARGKDFVLIGPPGTGKSQTISNLIAQCLAENKRVLFVSEKIAALDVVYRRLREVKLGEFCLELHSNKARKLDVLAQLKTAWEAKGDIDPEAWAAEARRLKRLRDELNVYVERLHHKHSNGQSIFDAIGVVVAGADMPALGLSWSSHSAHGAKDTEKLREVVDRLAVNASAVGPNALTSGPLKDVGQDDWSPTWQQMLIDAARAVVPAAERIQNTAESFCQAIGLETGQLTRRRRTALATLSRALPMASGKDWRFAFRADAKTISEALSAGCKLVVEHAQLNAELSPGWTAGVVHDAESGADLLARRTDLVGSLARPWPADAQESIANGVKLLERLESLGKTLSVRYSDGIEQVNVYLLHREYAKAQKSVWPMSWAGKRKVRKILEALVAGDGEPSVANDLTALVAIRDTRSAIEKHDIGPEASGIWFGLKSRAEVLTGALKLQAAAAAVKQGLAWTDEGLDALAAGRGGETLAGEVQKLRSIGELDQRINAFPNLRSQTGGLWRGLESDVHILRVATIFARLLEIIRSRGTMEGELQLVATGACGEMFSRDHQLLAKRTACERQLSSFDQLGMSTHGVWKGLDTDVQDVEKAIRFQGSMAAAISNLALAPSEVPAVSAVLERLVVDGNGLLDVNGPVAGRGQDYLDAWAKLQPAVDKLAQQGHFSDLAQADFQEIDIESLVGRCKNLVQSEARLHAWCPWRKVRGEAITLGLSPMVAGLENGAVAPADVMKAFETNYCRWWLNAVVDSEQVIRTFVSAEHEKRIADFRALDSKFTELTRAWVRASLCSGLPSPEDVTRNSEWGLLRREITKKRAHLPLRELIGGIPTAMVKLTPCLLMSPLSIAQYLAPDSEQFDVVVFDEASQIPVWDAIGAIARGKQVVMVGDPKQLPPTAFFDRAESSLDDEEVEGDMESILDECLGANLPTLDLSWHYRSRNESLIAFSNHRYYGGELVTFPSPVTEDKAVSFHYVKGVYEKGGARINKPEAKAVVADVVAKLKSPGFRASKHTIGVVTFNSEQQKLIEDLLDEERRKDPSIEPHFSEAELEPLFVKNLESVQGDERDIMYFSISYGPDMSGAVSMNFGPMNRDGGERRLNVAITRARQELRVFSSLKPDQMDLSRTQAHGVRDLKHFLEFAERGPKALAEATRGSLGDFESPFEEAVAGALAAKGWELHAQVGASSFRVDLAVVHPDAPGTYLSGIECDGATYHRSATARDRDKLREQVLRGLGWDILRIWSTDWWVDKNGTLDRIHAKLAALLEVSRKRRAEEAEMAAAKEAAEAALRKAHATVPAANKHPGEATRSGTALSEESVEVFDEVYARNAAQQGSSDLTSSQGQFYREVPTEELEGAAVADRFYEASYESVLIAMIEHVIQTEGPILDSVLARRISRAHQWQRTGGRIQERVEAIARQRFKNSKEDVGTFYWPQALPPGSPVAFRRPPEEQQRSIDEVCMPELQALAQMCHDPVNTDDENLVSMARALGIQRLRAASRVRLEEALRAVNRR